MNAKTRHALVTGAGSGIGREVALALSADGYQVFLAGRRAAQLEATAAKGEPGCMARNMGDTSVPEHG